MTSDLPFQKSQRKNAGVIVEDGYDQVAQTYNNQRYRFNNDELLQAYCLRLPANSSVLDVGCGAGFPVARFLVNAGFKVTGVDISTSMLELARVAVPAATFLQIDMRALAFGEGEYAGISAFYSLFHTPKEDHPQILADFYRFLQPNGILLFSTGTHAWQGVQDFNGADMYWSHPDPATTQQWVVEAGFTIIFAEVRDYGGEKMFWVMAQKKG